MERPLCDVKRKSSTGQEVGSENRARRRGKRADARPERNQTRKPMVKKGGEQLLFMELRLTPEGYRCRQGNRSGRHSEMLLGRGDPRACRNRNAEVPHRHFGPGDGL